MKKNKHGDTLVEVMLAMAIFAAISVFAVNIMNSGVNTAQRTLEITMARNEIDAQIEALRYIHQSYIAERQLPADQSQFRKLWNALRDAASKAININKSDKTNSFNMDTITTCDDVYATGKQIDTYHGFVLNTRLILPDTNTTYGGESYDTSISDIIVGAVHVIKNDIDTTKLKSATLYPRIVYRNQNNQTNVGNNGQSTLVENGFYDHIDKADGIWIVALPEYSSSSAAHSNYYDFYVRTCWQAAGQTPPSSITTIVRLYNPEVLE